MKIKNLSKICAKTTRLSNNVYKQITYQLAFPYRDENLKYFEIDAIKKLIA